MKNLHAISFFISILCVFGISISETAHYKAIAWKENTEQRWLKKPPHELRKLIHRGRRALCVALTSNVSSRISVLSGPGYGALRKRVCRDIRRRNKQHLKGSVFELEALICYVCLYKEDPVVSIGTVIKGREYDFITTQRIIECKNINWCILKQNNTDACNRRTAVCRQLQAGRDSAHSYNLRYMLITNCTDSLYCRECTDGLVDELVLIGR